MDESDQSSEMSDVDPQALIDSLKNIDDLDADLFSGSKAKTAKKPEKVPSVKSSLKQPTLEKKKKVSFHNSTELGKDDFGFDPDDPLGDLLPDDDDDFIFDREEPKTLVSKKTSKISEPPKVDKQVKEEKLFDDNDDDILDALGLDDEKPKSKERKRRAQHLMICWAFVQKQRLQNQRKSKEIYVLIRMGNSSKRILL
uniref:Fas-binding factor 1 homolog n=1 Tax=Ciona intestinalis TaxID=7719 RepID=H2XZH1_CIOIN|nr:fas-binding factor 1 homolog [Ciona intestinalis]|eukprot:XP_018671199.1 fas-binding factor 1 homolog [Ciona intestinalis]